METSINFGKRFIGITFVAFESHDTWWAIYYGMCVVPPPLTRMWMLYPLPLTRMLMLYPLPLTMVWMLYALPLTRVWMLYPLPLTMVWMLYPYPLPWCGVCTHPPH